MLKFSTVFASLLAFLILPRQVGNSCVWNPDPEPYELFAPALLDAPQLMPLRFSWNSFADTLDRTAVNLQDWRLFLGYEIPQEELRTIIYQSSTEELQTLERILSLATPHPTLSLPQLTKWLRAHPKLAVPFLHYLLYAKQCEPYAVRDIESWEMGEERHQATLSKLVETGENLYLEMPDDFLRMRVAYQTLRMAHYNQDFRACVGLYDRLVQDLKDPGHLQYWALSHRAGAILQLGNEGESAADFARVFVAAPELRVVAARSFRITNGANWEQALKLTAKDTQSQMALYTMRALQPTAIPLAEMKAIYQSSPRSAFLELLLIRELQKLEDKRLPEPGGFFPLRHGEPEIPSSATESEKDFIAFLEGVAREDKTNRPWMWRLAASHVHYLMRNYTQAGQWLRKTETSQLPTAATALHSLLQVAIPLGGFTKIERSEESWIWQNILHPHMSGKLGHKQTVNLLKLVLSQKYRQQGESVKAWMVENRDINYYEPTQDLLLGMLHLRLKQNATAYERWLSRVFTPSTNDIELRLGMLLLAEHRFTEALPHLEKGGTHKLPADPFVASIRDCNDCIYRDPPPNRPSRLEFTQRMIALQAQTERPKEAAMAWMNLGHGYYNMSYYGNCWQISQPLKDHSKVSWYAGYADPEYGLPPRGRALQVFMSNEKARAAYLRAAELAGSDELRAEALFMAAKCEQNELFNRFDKDQRLAKYAAHRTHFEELSAYTHTQFYQKARKECVYLMEFIKNKQ